MYKMRKFEAKDFAYYTNMRIIQIFTVASTMIFMQKKLIYLKTECSTYLLTKLGSM